MERKKLLIADDSEINRALLASILDQEFEIIEAADGKEVMEILQNYHEDILVLLLDIVMPEMNGFEVLEEMKYKGWIAKIPTIMISAETSGSYIERAFELGASDYINRPFVPGVIRRRIINTILMNTKKQQLMEVLDGWFSGQEKNNEIMLEILDYAVESRNGESGNHMFGVSYLTGLLLRRLLEKTDKYMLNLSDVDDICMASGLHDIGKLMISQRILQKPGKLTAEEFDTIKKHTEYGAKIVAEVPDYQNENLVKHAMMICRWHHERWNGEGYPDGLKGDGIPIAAQVVSLADAYSALINERSYKEAFSHEKAMAMLHRGECGSFNPLLLECLDDVEEAIRLHKSELHTQKSHYKPHGAMDEMYRGEDRAAARITRELEETNIKIEFFSDLCRESWFEYTSQPESLHLSYGAMQRTGLPKIIVNPTENKALLKVIGSETISQIEEKLRQVTTDTSYIEFTTKFFLNGKWCRCQIVALILWSASKEAKCRGLFGKVVDINENYERLEEYDKASVQQTQQVLLPVLAEEQDVLKIKKDQVGMILQSYRKMFDTVRLVDPGICMQVTTGAEGHSVEKNENCYAIWGRARRCENCISQNVIHTKKTQSKIETIGREVYYVVAMCVEIEGMYYSLECVNRVQTADMGTNENILNQLLVRNRQVYTDSVTKIFNRRYYEEHIRGLTGEYAMAMLDVDNFKEINDWFGHAVGDSVLYRIAQTIRSVLRSNDKLMRYGGDEFFLLFHGLPEQVLEKKLDGICKAVRDMEIPEHPEVRLSVSIGGLYASGRVSELIKMADLALYRAKAQKGHVVLFKEETL